MNPINPLINFVYANPTISIIAGFVIAGLIVYAACDYISKNA